MGYIERKFCIWQAGGKTVRRARARTAEFG